MTEEDIETLIIRHRQDPGYYGNCEALYAKLRELFRLKSAALGAPVAWESRTKYSTGWGAWTPIGRENAETLNAEWGGYSGNIGKYPTEIRPLYTA